MLDADADVIPIAIRLGRAMLTSSITIENNTNEIEVSYGGNEVVKRKDFVWTLFSDRDIIITVANFLSFMIKFPQHGPGRQRYRELRQRYIQSRPESEVNIGLLGVEPETRQVTGTSTPLLKWSKPAYVGRGYLGEGTFGIIDKAIDVSSRELYARKTFRPCVPKNEYMAEVNLLKSLKHVSVCSGFVAELTPLRRILSSTKTSQWSMKYLN